MNTINNVNKANKILSVGIMIGQALSGQVTKQLIQDLDCSISLNKRSVLALNYEIWLLKLNSSEQIKVYSFCSRLTTCYVNLPQWILLKYRYMYVKTYAKFTFCVKSPGHVSDENFSYYYMHIASKISFYGV